MEIKEKVEEIVKKITGDKDLMAQFKEDPEKAVGSLVGVELPEGALDKVVDAVKAKLGADKLGDIAGKLKNLF